MHMCIKHIRKHSINTAAHADGLGPTGLNKANLEDSAAPVLLLSTIAITAAYIQLSILTRASSSMIIWMEYYFDRMSFAFCMTWSKVVVLIR